MKKLMIAVAVVALALGAQASTVKWTISYGGTDYTQVAGTSAMLFDSTARTQVLAIFNDFGAEGKTLADLQALAIESATDVPGVITPVIYARQATGFTSANGINVSSSDSAFAVIFEGSIAVGTTYQMADAVSLAGYTAEPPAPPESTLTFTAANFTTTGTIQTAAVPEPTSGLLLLLGVAGMALRRKRA